MGEREKAVRYEVVTITLIIPVNSSQQQSLLVGNEWVGGAHCWGLNVSTESSLTSAARCTHHSDRGVVFIAIWSVPMARALLS